MLMLHPLPDLVDCTALSNPARIEPGFKGGTRQGKGKGDGDWLPGAHNRLLPLAGCQTAFLTGCQTAFLTGCQTADLTGCQSDAFSPAG